MKYPLLRSFLLGFILIALPACGLRRQVGRSESHQIVVTCAQVKDVTVTQQYVCQIHSQRHIKICSFDKGYLEEISIKEGQEVKTGDVLFKVVPVIYQAEFDVEQAEQDVAQMEYDFSKELSEKKVVSPNEVRLLKAKLARAQAKAHLADAELKFATVKAPFDGIVDHLYQQQGSFIDEGDPLTTLSDNSVMWVYFNVPEASYLEYMTELRQHQEDLKIELQLANGKKFSQPGKISTIEADFNNTTGNIPFRADFPNPDRLLRYGQTGKILVSRVLNDAVVIPQRATFQILDKRYVYIVDHQNVAHQREIQVESESDDIFVVQAGLGVNDKIIFEGAREVRDGDTVEYEYRSPQQVISHQKYHAE